MIKMTRVTGASREYIENQINSMLMSYGYKRIINIDVKSSFDSSNGYSSYTADVIFEY